MNDIKRKLWWYSLAIPLRGLSQWYRYFPPSSNEPQRVSSIISETLNPVFHNYHFSYAYYSGITDFSISMGIDTNTSFKTRKRQDGNKFNPILVALDALVSYNEYYIAKAISANDRFLDACDFLESYAIKEEEALWFPYYFDYPKYGMKAPWVSGLTQALILSVFLRKKDVSPITLKKIYNSLWTPLDKGGVFTTHPTGYPWIAEYPGKKVPFVFNGQLSVLITLLEYLTLYPEEKLRDTLTRMINGIFSDYYLYILNSNIKYCWTKPKLASIHYQGLHAFQLVHLYRLTQSDSLKKLAEDWISRINWSDFARFHFIQDSTKLIKILGAGIENPAFPFNENRTH